MFHALLKQRMEENQPLEEKMKNTDRIKSMSEEELTELFHEIPFDCAERCPDFGNGCLGTCTHDAGRDFIRDWLNEEN